ELAVSFVYQAAFAHAAVVRFVMLESKVCNVITESVEKVVVLVVLGAEQRSRLRDQVLVVIPDLLRRLKCGSAVGGHVEFGRGLPCGKWNGLHVLPGKDRRVDEHGQRHRTEVEITAIRVADGK